MATENATPGFTPAQIALAFKRYGSDTIWIGDSMVEVGILDFGADKAGNPDPLPGTVGQDLLISAIGIADLLRSKTDNGEPYTWTPAVASGLQCLVSLATAFIGIELRQARKELRHE